MPSSTILLAWNLCCITEAHLQKSIGVSLKEHYLKDIVQDAKWGIAICDTHLKFNPNNQLVKNYKSAFQRILKLYGSD